MKNSNFFEGLCNCQFFENINIFSDVGTLFVKQKTTVNWNRKDITFSV